MKLHRVFGYSQPVGNGLISETLGHHPQYFGLTVGERLN